MDSTTSQAGNVRLPYESGANVIEGSEVVRIPEELKQEPVPDGRRDELPFAAACHTTTADPGIFTDTGKKIQVSEPKTSWAGAPKNVVEGVVQPLTTGQFKLDTTSMTIPEQVLQTNNNTKIPLEVYNNKTPYYGDAADRAENIAPLAPVLDASSPDGHGNLPVGVLKPGSLS